MYKLGHNIFMDDLNSFSTDDILKSPENVREEKFSFLVWFIDLILGRNLQSSQAKQLRNINKRISKEGYRYYNFYKGKIQTSFAKLLFEVYRVIAPMRESFLNNTDDEYYKHQILNISHTDRQNQILSFLAPDELRNACNREDIKSVYERGKIQFEEYKRIYGEEFCAKINLLYSSTLVLKRFCLLDYYVALKHFCNSLEENTFSSDPHFVQVQKQYVQDFILDFLSAAAVLTSVDDYPNIISSLSKFMPLENFDVQGFLHVVKLFSTMNEKHVLADFARLIKSDVMNELSFSVPSKDIVHPEIELVYDDFRSTMEELIQERKDLVYSRLIEQAFGGDDIPSLRFYTEEESKLYEKKDVHGFDHWKNLEFVYGFLEKTFRVDVSSFVGIFSAVGITSDKEFMTSITTVYRDLLNLLDEIVKFDELFDTKFANGNKMRSMLKNAGDDKIALQLNVKIDELNKKAEWLIVSVIDKVKIIGEYFRTLLDDVVKNPSTVVRNWGEIDNQMKVASQVQLQTINLKTVSFIRLMDSVFEPSITR